MTPEKATGWGNVPALRDEALRLCARASERNMTLRVTGSLAILLICSAQAGLMQTLGRQPPRDIDLMGYSREQREIEALFTDEGWQLDPTIRWSREWGIKRLIYLSADARFKVDVFLDQLVMSHTVDLRNRLQLGSPTITPVDLLLSKLQIHDVTHNDLLDLIVLLAEHDLGDGQAGTIDRGHLLAVLSGDWGFWYSARTNLDRAESALGSASGVPPATASAVNARIHAIRTALDDGPKSRRWRLRAAVGTRLAWYQDVDEVERGEGSDPV